MGGCSAAAARSTPVLVGRPRPSLRSSASLSLLSVSAAASAVCRIAHFAFPSVRLPRAAASLPPSLCSSPWEPTALTAGRHGGALKGGPLWQAADLLGSWVTKPRPQTWGWAELSPFPPWTGSKETPVIVETAVELRARCAWGHVLASLGNPLHFSDSDIIAVLEYFHEPGAMSRTGGQCLLVSCSGP